LKLPNQNLQANLERIITKSSHTSLGLILKSPHRKGQARTNGS